MLGRDPEVALSLAVLGGSWVVLSRVLVRGLVTPLITTHEPPSTGRCTPSEETF